MKQNTTTGQVARLLDDIRKMADQLPEGERRRMLTKCDYITASLKSAERRNIPVHIDRLVGEEQRDQIAARAIAKAEIFKAMTAGRKISLLDSHEFRVSQMHSQMVFIRRDIERKNLPYEMASEWITYGPKNRRIKRYWLEEIPQDVNPEFETKTN